MSNYPNARLALRAEITVDSGNEDVYAWAWMRAIDVCELATLANVHLPAEVAATFRAAPGLTWENYTERALAGLLSATWTHVVDDYGPDAAADALTYWARVLLRYLHLPAVAALAD